MLRKIYPSLEAEKQSHKLSANPIVYLSEVIIQESRENMSLTEFRTRRFISLAGHLLIDGLIALSFATVSHGDTKAYESYKDFRDGKTQ